MQFEYYFTRAFRNHLIILKIFRLKKLQENIAVDNYNKDYPSDHENEEIKLEEVLNFLENTVDNQINNLRSIYPRFYNDYRTARMLKEPSDLTRRDQTSQVNYYF